MLKPKLLAVEDAKHLTQQANARLFCTHINPAQYHYMKLLGFHKILIDHAEGMYYYDRFGHKIMDLFGCFGALALGHNHSRILAVRSQFQKEKRHEIAMAFISQYASVLAKNLSAIAPENLDMVFFGTSGSEAVEAALKLAEKVQGPSRSTIAYAGSSFHGKSRGALSVTDSAFYASSFQLLKNTVKVPFGDIVVLEQLFNSDPSVGILILETIQGGAGIITAPAEYWHKVRYLCTKYNVIWIADEVQCGVGRTGQFFAFEHNNTVPDIVTLAKSLGGGKTAISATISRRPLHMTAYGTPKLALIHGPATFSGMGEACCTAIETLNILYDEGLIENSEKMGTLLLELLNALQRKHATIIKEIRGIGLMVGIEFHDFSHAMPLHLEKIISTLDEKLKGSLCGFVGSILLRDHQILVGFTEYNRNVIRIEPPLIITADEVNTFINALDEVLSRGLARIVLSYIKNLFSSTAI
ncbi:aspartate aminotransferase family protein [Chitinophaga sp. GbtcB8]|uniref:aspartate aminotransferase family protein n=1 Tax=Chitinophaga sp. GbtcB8 TaxID=2824753 RepID=UPI001C301DE5|nr:aminotransferase class III-fold pyridoxal phosphate-dependent enzyme [Chitinophaga sp. GbtcB8]